MKQLGLLVAVLGGLALSWFLTAWVRRYALRSALLDHPNERSSHTVATPRGGGVAIVVSCLAVAAALAAAEMLALRLFAAALVAGGVVAGLGFLDDRYGLAARWRFLGHAAAAAWVVYSLASIPPLTIAGWRLDLPVLGAFLAGVYLVWMINLFNFMDGIDGIASVEGISVALGGALVWWMDGSGSDWVLALVFAGCVAGFLAWNFPPAKIFMGDAGSGFLGLMVALLSLWCGQDAPHLFWAWFILAGCFLVDATTTLVRRVMAGERFYEAHRNHAFQYASRKHRTHKGVTLVVGALNLFWLLPWALAVASQHVDGALGTALAFLPLIVLALRYKAGNRASQEV
jgi:Fuc2NAc and GlcNAc transferase